MLRGLLHDDGCSHFITLCGFSMLKPADGRLKKSTSTEKDTQFDDNLVFKYKLEKDNKASSDIVLTMMIDEWIKHYLIMDAEPVATSAAAPKETLVEINNHSINFSKQQRPQRCGLSLCT